MNETLHLLIDLATVIVAVGGSFYISARKARTEANGVVADTAGKYQTLASRQIDINSMQELVIIDQERELARVIAEKNGLVLKLNNLEVQLRLPEKP